MAAHCTYRKLLKALHTHVTKDPSKSSFRDYVYLEYRKNAGMADGPLLREKLQLAEDYATLLTSIHFHKELLFSYNIAVDREAEQKARIKNTAERVGLQLPKLEFEIDDKTSSSIT
eukprot:c20389_g1_i1 orf=237-584(+)